MMLTTAGERASLAALFDRLADAAAAQTLPRFRAGQCIDNKLDASQGFDPVTEADRAAERAIRDILDRERPLDGVIGEEFGSVRTDARDVWIIDPVDGTRAFVAGLPVWGTLIALYRDGRPAAGMVDQPFTGERFVGLAGRGATLSMRGAPPRVITPSRRDRLAEATLMTTSPDIFGERETAAFHRLRRATRLTRYGADCYAYALLAAGHVDLVVEDGLQIYDIAAPLALMAAAGATVSDWQGGDPSRGGGVVAAATPALHARALTVLQG